MKNNLTELVFILDRSGSMHGLENDTIGGFNTLLRKQKLEEGDAIVTTVLFDDAYEILHDRVPIQCVERITEKDYFTRGLTALLDAIGHTIHKVDNAVKNTKEEGQPDKVLFVITTDGHENASKRFNVDQIQSLIKKQQEMSGWEFIFIGANIDSVAQARSFGIHEDNAVNYRHDASGTSMKYQAMSEAISQVRKIKNSVWIGRKRSKKTSKEDCKSRRRHRKVPFFEMMLKAQDRV